MPGAVVALFPDINPKHEIEMLCAVFMSQHERLGQDSPLRLFAVELKEAASENTQQTVFDKIARLLRCYTIEIGRGKPLVARLHLSKTLVHMHTDANLLRCNDAILDEMNELFDKWDRFQELSDHVPVHGIDTLAGTHAFPVTPTLIMQVLDGMTTTPGIAWLGYDTLLCSYMLLLLYQSISPRVLAESSEADVMILLRITRLLLRQLGHCRQTTGVSLWTEREVDSYRTQFLIRTLAKLRVCFENDSKFFKALFAMPGSDEMLVSTMPYDGDVVIEMDSLVFSFFEYPELCVHDLVSTCLRETYMFQLEHNFSVMDFITCTFYEGYENVSSLPISEVRNEIRPGLESLCTDIGKNLLQSLFAQFLVQECFEASVATFMLIACVLFPMRICNNDQAFTLLPPCIFSHSVFRRKTVQALRFDNRRTYLRVERMLRNFRMNVYSCQSAKPEVFATYNRLIFGRPSTAELRHMMPSMLLQSIGQLNDVLEVANAAYPDGSRA